ncbi:5-formyltetrahydrofolate cyclo-ligase [soil metagenome]
MLKTILRREALQKRENYPAEELARRSRRICELFFSSFSLEAVRLLHLFLPISRQNELDTRFLIRRLWLKHPEVAIAVPVSDLDLTHMTHFLLRPNTVLAENRWGIPEPVEAVEVPAEAVDLVLLPLLTFDLRGNRVGYGKGFYDRFLDQCRPDVLKVGLSLEPPVPLITDTNEFDVSLDAAVTPEEVYRFSGGKPVR